MKKSRFSEVQIIGVLREQEAGARTAEFDVPGTGPLAHPGAVQRTRGFIFSSMGMV